MSCALFLEISSVPTESQPADDTHALCHREIYGETYQQIRKAGQVAGEYQRQQLDDASSNGYVDASSNKHP